ncbi:TFIIB-type zinc ribbon-containing protein [Stetteria hydrogenophila]
MAGEPLGWDSYEPEHAEAETLPYGIRRRPVRYYCLRCGREILKEELDSRPVKYCPYCGFRIFVKARDPSSGYIRRVYAV